MSDGFAVLEMVQREKWREKKGDEKCAFTSMKSGVVLEHLWADRMAFYDKLGEDFELGRPTYFSEMLPSNDDAATSVCVDLDFDVIDDNQAALADLQKMTKIFWLVLKELLPNQQDVAVLGCMSWPPLSYIYDEDQGSLKAVTKIFQMFGHEVILSDMLLERERLRKVHAEPDVNLESFDTQARRWRKGGWRVAEDAFPEEGALDLREENNPAPNLEGQDERKGLKLGMHLYAVTRVNKQTHDATLLFVKRQDLRKVAIVFAHQLDVYFGPKFDKSWLKVVDYDITGLRIVGSNKYDFCSDCMGLKTITNKRDLKAKLSASDKAGCKACGGRGRRDCGRPYLPVFFVDTDGALDANNYPLRLANDIPAALRLTRIAHYPDVDPPVARVRIPEKWLLDASAVTYVEAMNVVGKASKLKAKKNRLTCLPRTPKPVSPFVVSEHAQLEATFYEWLKSGNAELTWRQATIQKIVFLTVNKGYWCASVFLHQTGLHCRRERAVHSKSQIWFVLNSRDLAAHKLTQHCFACKDTAPGICSTEDKNLFVAFQQEAERLSGSSPKDRSDHDPSDSAVGHRRSDEQPKDKLSEALDAATAVSFVRFKPRASQPPRPPARRPSQGSQSSQLSQLSQSSEVDWFSELKLDLSQDFVQVTNIDKKRKGSDDLLSDGPAKKTKPNDMRKLWGGIKA